MAERDLYDPIIAHCQKVLPRCRLFTHGKSFRDEHGVWRNAALCVGMADLVGWVDGHWLEVEVKTLKGTQEKSQRAHEALVKSHGGIYVVARSPEEAERLVRAELARRSTNAHLTITLLEGENRIMDIGHDSGHPDNIPSLPRYRVACVSVGHSIESSAIAAGYSPRALWFVLKRQRPASEALIGAVRNVLGPAAWAYAIGETDTLPCQPELRQRAA